ncbi:hypothetical protein [Kutzneria buriramensis]|uniref:Uncharacterized protein n=1 Tax=Kutzneria buriramensis TaxID=1045776 RepID=A0A3E0HEU9_9PSEU|nr:hypothetical protein [Kutzneria buriramensis]REH43693.1 hypothetical protein BCF44_109236 [Kutzneria buriramensis]
MIFVAAAALLAACSGGQQQNQAAPAQPSAYDLVLQQVKPDGTVDKATALAAFSLAVAPLPDVPTPPGPKAQPVSGSLAVSWVMVHWAELTAAQQDAVRHALTDGVNPAAAITGPGTPDPNIACVKADSPDAGPWRQQLDSAISDIASHLGRTMKMHVFLTVNTKQLEDHDNGTPALMYTWACKANKTANGQNPDGCTIHVNPAANDAQFSDHDRKSFLIHEAMHCFLYDKFGAAYDDIAPWLVEGIPIWVQTALNGADPVATKWWGAYLDLNKTSLYKRSYDALGFYAQLADSGVDVWSKIDPMVAAGISGGNAAAWQASGAGDDFVGVWGPGHAKGRHPGKPWDITGYGVPDTKPAAAHVDLANGQTAKAAAPVTGVDLVELNIQSDVVGFAGDAATRGMFGAADGHDHQFADLDGAEFCAKQGGCTCPEGSPGAGTQLPPIAAGTGYLGISGGAKATAVSVTGMSLDDFCKRPAKGCLVGTWTSVAFDIAAGAGLTEHGGAGVKLTIDAKGAVAVDFNPMQPIVGHVQDMTVDIVFGGVSTGHITLPPPNVTTGNWGDAHGEFGNVTVTAGATSPIQFTLFDHKPVSDVLALGEGLASGLGGGISSQPLLGPGGFKCSPTQLVITPPPGSSVQGTWTLSRS